MKRLSRSLLALGFTALAVVSCARREPTAAPPASLSLHLTSDPATLDPTTITEDEELRVVSMMFRPLVGIDRELRAVPALAKSWNVSPDGLIYEFHLDPTATWDDGSRVSSDDVRFTIERVRDPKVNAASWSGGFEGLVGIETPDPATIRVRFQRPYAERILAFNMPIVSEAVYGRAKTRTETDRTPAGSGPYRFASWEPNRSVRLTRRPDAQPGGFSEVVFRVIPNDSTRFQAGSRGELDEFRVSRDQRAAAEANPEFLKRNRILRVPQAVEVLLIWNVKNRFPGGPPRAPGALARVVPRATRRSFSILPTGPRWCRGRFRRASRPTRRTWRPPPSTRLSPRASWTKPAGVSAREASAARAGARPR